MVNGVGYIEYENRDKTPMNEQKERFLYFYNFYVEKGKNIATTLEVLDFLTTHDEEYKNISTIAPAFMNSVFNNFWAQAVIQLYEFYYASNGLSFKNFFNYTKANWNLIFTGDFYEHIYHGEKKDTQKVKFSREYILGIFDECNKIIENNKAKIETLGFFRDNMFAHYSDLSKKQSEITISIDDLIEILNITQEIVNKIGVIYNRTAIVFKPINATDIYQICYAIKKYKEMRGVE